MTRLVEDNANEAGGAQRAPVQARDVGDADVRQRQRRLSALNTSQRRAVSVDKAQAGLQTRRHAAPAQHVGRGARQPS